MAPLEDPRPEQLVAIELAEEGVAIEVAEEGVAIELADDGAVIGVAEEGAAFELSEGPAIELADDNARGAEDAARGVEDAARGVAEDAARGVAEDAARGVAEEGAAGGERGSGSGAPGRRVRLARGVAELPGDLAVVVLHEDTFLRWRPTPSRPDGVLSRLAEVAVGAAIAVEHGGYWDEGLVLGRVVRPARAGGFQVDGDVERYPSIAEAEQAHGPLDAGDPQEPPARTGDPAFELGEPMGRDPRGLARRAKR